MSAEIAAPPRERGLALTAFLIYLGLANLWWAWRYWEVYRDFVDHLAPNVAYWPWAAMAALSLVVVAGVAALFGWQRWGAWLIGAAALAGLVIGYQYELLSWLILISVGGVVILVALLRPKWQDFR